MTGKRFTLNYEINNYEDFMIKDNQKEKVLYDEDIEKVLNEQDQRIKELTKENKRLKSDLARVIEQASKNDKFLRSDIRTLENALWCPNCANDIKRLKELRKEFLK